MSKSIISEGKTTNEAIENGLKELKVSRNMVDVKVVENEDKRSFFSILAPRVVKVELTLKEDVTKTTREITDIKISKEDIKKAQKNLQIFLDDFIKRIGQEIKYAIKIEENTINIKISGDKVGYLIGYKGDTLYAFQNILSSIANKDTENRVRVLLDIAGYKEKRIKTLEELAEKLARTVIRTGKSITLEPMQPYERKIIHNKLQENREVSTKSIGEEPKRRVVISLIK